MLNFGMNMPYYLMMLYGSVMIVMVLILRGLFRNRLPKFIFPVLWGIVLLRFVLPFSVSSPLSISIPWNYLSPFGTTYSFDAVAAAESGSASESVVEDTQKVTSTAYSNVDISQDVSTGVTSVAEGSSIYLRDIAVSDVYLYHDLFDSISFSDFIIVRRILLLICILGAMAAAGILGWQKFRYIKRLRSGLLIENNETINALLRDMDMGHVLVFSSDEIASPMVCGLLNPRIYLPTQMDFRNTMLLRHVLAHETMHIRRKDNWMKCIMVIVLCLNWFNPLVWIMSRCLASDLEAACDEAVLRQHGEDAKKDYAFSLLAMAVSGNRTSLLYSAFSKTEVEKRVKNILSYKKVTFLAVLFTVLLMAGSITAFASIGQAPFWSELTSFCFSSHSKWGVDVSITRDVALGKDAQERAEDVVFSVLGSGETGDPEVIESRILTALAQEFGVERGAFRVETSLVISAEQLKEEYEPWGLSSESGTTFWKYKDETIRSYEDKMLGSYQSNVAGTVDVYVLRDNCGEIISVEVFHEGDPEYDEHTRKLERTNQDVWSNGEYTGTAELEQVDRQ